MTTIENQIIESVMQNKYIGEFDKPKYISAMFLMTEKNQKKLLKKLKRYQKKCNEIEKGHFLLKPKEANLLKSIFKNIKERLFLKTKLA
jgi:hypothetical protein